ncbi:MAG TPA: tetratricopeptide repeat protein [Opitutaceae bacterium]|nr:tetratricopeptide repeat protein [Opitutaceae bacterium]
MPASPGPTASPRPGAVLVAGSLLVLAIAAAYSNTFRVPFLMDDLFSIQNNESIRHLDQIGRLLRPEGFLVANRPLLNLSFALNYAWSGEATWSYHLVDLLVHVTGALALFGIARRTLECPRLAARFGGAALPLGALLAALWALHPLQTEAVTYITQRAESMMGMFYLLALYGFIRGREARGWSVFAVACCCLGMGTKQVMVTAPVVVLLYDRAFWSASFREALARRPGAYSGLAASWLLLALLAAVSPIRDRSIGFHAGVSPLTYAFTEAKGISLYLRLALWPHPLVFDYGGPEVLLPRLSAALPYLLLIAAALALSAWAWRRSPPLGFLASVFFILLSPNSSFVPLAQQPISEHRMYLPLAPLLALAAAALWSWAGRRALPLLGAAALALGLAAHARNADYRSALGLWRGAIARYPDNARGLNNLAQEEARVPGLESRAVAHYEAALRIRPDFAEVHYNLAVALGRMPGRAAESAAHFRRALDLGLDLPETRRHLAAELAQLPGREAEALAQYRAAVLMDPGYAPARYDFANELAKLPGRRAEAIAQYEAALRIDPGFADAHDNLANQLAALPGRQEEAIAHYRAALRLAPGNAEAHNNLAVVLSGLPGRQEEALGQFREAVRIKPGFIQARYGLAAACLRLGRLDEAIAQLEAVVRLDPADPAARRALENLREQRAR